MALRQANSCSRRKAREAVTNCKVAENLSRLDFQPEQSLSSPSEVKFLFFL